ncbi:hypothetical protein NEF87_004843 [Candidatus Lokiarchaeum ossiferum]|uniref:Uncharacterized protein n=1 Tax=Candidatus Lokiarchaeum ossiferum TaxID=2951803 RepID=A0ABY6HYU4_9ARCH|nr:hypothetical protein NEF87_004843 [Candidatus Lokiarchaeum sp. B-35]
MDTIYKDLWIKDFSDRLRKYEESKKEPLKHVKQYFVDSGNFLLFLNDFYKKDPNHKSIQNWLYHLGSLFGQNISSYYYGYLLNQKSIDDFKNSNNLIAQMLILFKTMELFNVPSDISILKTFFTRIHRYLSNLGSRFTDQYLGSLVCYGYCLSIEFFGYYLKNTMENAFYRKTARNCLNISIKRLSNFLKKKKIIQIYPNAISLWIFILNISQNNSDIEKALISKNQNLRQEILRNLDKLTKFQSLGYSLYSSIDDKILYQSIVAAAKKAHNTFKYTGSYWNNIPRYAMTEFFSSIYGNEIIEKEYITSFNSYSLDIPLSFIDKLIGKTIDIQNMIEFNSTMQEIIINKQYKEENFRDYFLDQFHSNYWISEREKETIKKTKCDLNIKTSHNMFRISFEFKIWPRNFKEYPPIEELIGNMGFNDKIGILYMINENLNSIDTTYKNRLIENHRLSIPGTFEEFNIQGSSKKYYFSKYKTDEGRIVEIFHFIFDLFPFWK